MSVGIQSRAAASNLRHVKESDLPPLIPDNDRRGINKLVEGKVKPALKLIAKIAAYIDMDVLVMMTAHHFAWVLYDLAEERGEKISDYVAASVACLSLSTKKRCRDNPSFQDLLGATMLQGVFCRHSDLKQLTPSFVREMQPRVEEYEAFLLHALGINVDFDDPFLRVDKILGHFRRKYPGKLDEFETLKAVAGQFLGGSGFTRALLHFGTRQPQVLCVSAIILAAHIVLDQPIRKELLTVSEVSQTSAFLCLNFLLQGMSQFVRDDWLVQQRMSKVKRSTTEFNFIIRKRDGTYDAECKFYEQAEDKGKNARAVAQQLRASSPRATESTKEATRSKSKQPEVSKPTKVVSKNEEKEKLQEDKADNKQDSDEDLSPTEPLGNLSNQNDDKVETPMATTSPRKRKRESKPTT